MYFCGSLFALVEYFLEKKNQISVLIKILSFIELFLFNIMKYGNNDIESQTIIQGMSLIDFGII